MVNLRYRMYPSMVGLLLGLLQTGLYFQLSFTLSSSIRTFLMITVSWLLGNIIGIQLARQYRIPLSACIWLAIAAYFACVLLLKAAPFSTQLWYVYVVLIALTGLYPGVFFARMSAVYPARALFLGENNGFIVGLVLGSLLFMVLGRVILWSLPVGVVLLLFLIGEPQAGWLVASNEKTITKGNLT
jgi:hypothetical protein